MRKPNSGSFKRRGTFWDHVDKSAGVDACWPWQASRKPSGHGNYWWNGRVQAAHRLALILTGSLPPHARSYACHHCDNPPCCNPSHLYWGDATTNMRDLFDRNPPNRFGSRNGLFIDLAGRRFGRLVVLAQAPNRSARVVWLCRCDCGREAQVKAAELAKGDTTSCGCWARQSKLRASMRRRAHAWFLGIKLPPLKKNRSRQREIAT